MVARSLIDGTLGELKSVPEDSQALKKLSLKMASCDVIPIQMNCLEDLNSLQTMEELVGVLPSRIRELWAKTVTDMLRCGNDPTFGALKAMVSIVARISEVGLVS